MNLLRIAVLLLGASGSLHAQRNNWKPTDFTPLTSLPWKDGALTIEEVLDRIFRETNPTIRYAVLWAYLHRIEVADFSKVFELCISLEGTQTPDEMVSLMLRIWAERDPQAAWRRTQALFKLVGIEDHWLGYDSWRGRPKIMVQDRSAIENSAFWLDRDTLLNFPEGVELATVPLTERDTLRKAFASLWINTFHSWPGNSRPLQIFSSSSYTSVNEIIAAFDKPNVFDPSSINAYGESKSDEAVLEIGVRRWLADQPDQAPRVLKVIGDWKWTSTHGEPSRPAELSTELLIVWSKADPTGLQKWADDPAHSDEKMVTVARSLLMDRVNEAVRQRWLDSMTEGSDDKVSERFDCLAGWHPQLGIDAAVRTANPYNVTTAIAGASRGPWWAWPVNTCHSGLGFMHQFDLNGLPEGLKQEVVGIWSNQLDFMESWGEVDIGEAARYGMHFLLTYKYASRTEVIQFLREGGDEGGMLDRTFCALRVWAVVRPTEMREWIKTQKGDDLQQALTWLLEHPWGTAETE